MKSIGSSSSSPSSAAACLTFLASGTDFPVLAFMLPKIFFCSGASRYGIALDGQSPDPGDSKALRESKLSWSEGTRHAPTMRGEPSRLTAGLRELLMPPPCLRGSDPISRSRATSRGDAELKRLEGPSFVVEVPARLRVDDDDGEFPLSGVPALLDARLTRGDAVRLHAVVLPDGLLACRRRSGGGTEEEVEKSES